MAVGNSGSEKHAKASCILDFVQPFFVVVSFRVMHNRVTKEGLLVLLFCAHLLSQFCHQYANKPGWRSFSTHFCTLSGFDHFKHFVIVFIFVLFVALNQLHTSN